MRHGGHDAAPQLRARLGGTDLLLLALARLAIAIAGGSPVRRPFPVTELDEAATAPSRQVGVVEGQIQAIRRGRPPPLSPAASAIVGRSIMLRSGHNAALRSAGGGCAWPPLLSDDGESASPAVRCMTWMIGASAAGTGARLRSCAATAEEARRDGKACWSRTAISFSISGTGSGSSTLKRSAPDENEYSCRSSPSSAKTEPLCGR